MSTAAIGDIVPEGINVDIIIINSQTDGTVCSKNEAQDFGCILKSTKKAVVFAVPVSTDIICFFNDNVYIMFLLLLIDFIDRVHSQRLAPLNISLVLYQMPLPSKQMT